MTTAADISVELIDHMGNSHAQLENLKVAEPIALAAAQHFPESWKALLA